MKPTALITGGTRGIGLGIASELAKAGYDLVLNGVREREQVEGIISELQGLQARVLYCQADISRQEQREHLLSCALKEFGLLNLLVNNAGVAPQERDDLLDLPEESYDRVMTINLKGPFFLTQMIANHMVKAKNANHEFSGCIINIGSVSASMVSTNRGQYCISKAGVAMMTQLFAVRLGPIGIPVYEVRPGVIETDMTAVVLGKYNEKVDQGLFVQNRLGVPADVGKAVAALASGSFPYAAGNVITIDGGLSIPRL